MNMKHTAPLQRPANVRELYIVEREAIDAIVSKATSDPRYMQELLSPLATATRQQAATWKKDEFMKRFLSEGQASTRRYFTRENIAGWSMFDVLDQAKKAGKAETFEDYLAYVLVAVPEETLLRNLLLQAYTMKLAREIKRLNECPDEWAAWWYDISLWFARSHLLTPYAGKQREDYYKSVADEFTSRYDGIKLIKTSPENDQKYMIDYMFVSTKDRLPLKAVSVKGPTYRSGKDKGESYVMSGERRENRGHALLRKDWGVGVLVIISDPDAPMGAGKLDIISDLKPFFDELVADGTITKKGI